MIQSHPRNEASGITRLLAVAIACLLIGFAVGQAAPSVIGAFQAAEPAAPSVTRQMPALTTADDYGTRHTQRAAIPPLTHMDDYWTRHHIVPMPLGPNDDYGTRH
jgi:hypothetical protein